MNTEQLDAVWAELPTPDVAGRLQATAVGRDVWAAVDHEGHRHLLVEVPDDASAPPTTTRGLQVTVARHQVQNAEPAAYLDLKCLSEDVAATFTAVAADIGASTDDVPVVERMQEAAEALARWQWFWGVEPGLLSERDALGLFAELWFLLRWAGISASNLHAWTGSDGSRHDFQWAKLSVEVKAAARRADGGVTHRIQHLDQLDDPEEGQLFLFSLRVVRDQLAHNTLPDLVDRITDDLRGNPELRDVFARKVGQRGYSPAHRRRYAIPYRILGEHLYRVTEGFPRLTSSSFGSGIPSGVVDVSYLIDMAVCDAWLVATSHDRWPPQ